jgi:membrane protein implicated in regulation of membrane protease activity
MAAPVGASHGRRAATMKSPKRIAALLLAGFLAFAPPGTMIFLLALAIGLVGRRWAIAAALCLCACAALLLLLRGKRRARPRADEFTHTDTK